MEHLDLVYRAIDEDHADQPAHTRRQIVGGAAAALGGMGLLAIPDWAKAATTDNSAQNILNIAATAEVLATIVNTVGPEKVHLDHTTRSNVRAAAREELIHYRTLVSVGAKPLTKKIWVPDAVFHSKKNLLNTLVTGDQIFINAYLIGVTAFAKAGQDKFARYSAEIMGVEAVHRALAKQSLKQLGNDRAFMRYAFTDIDTAPKLLQKAGFGFGVKGSNPGRFYDFATVSKRTPNPKSVNTRTPH